MTLAQHLPGHSEGGLLLRAEQPATIIPPENTVYY